jgi:hypothetical protein
MLYSDGSFIFQYGNKVESGKTLSNSYTEFKDVEYISYSQRPWNGVANNIKTFDINDDIDVKSMTYWFYSCTNLTGSPACGDKVTNMFNTYSSCRNLTGSPACGNNVTNMACTYSSCSNLTGSPVCGDNVTDMARTY